MRFYEWYVNDASVSLCWRFWILRIFSDRRLSGGLRITLRIEYEFFFQLLSVQKLFLIPKVVCVIYALCVNVAIPTISRSIIVLFPAHYIIDMIFIIFERWSVVGKSWISVTNCYPCILPFYRWIARVTLVVVDNRFSTSKRAAGVAVFEYAAASPPLFRQIT